MLKRACVCHYVLPYVTPEPSYHACSPYSFTFVCIYQRLLYHLNATSLSTIVYSCHAILNTYTRSRCIHTSSRSLKMFPSQIRYSKTTSTTSMTTFHHRLTSARVCAGRRPCAAPRRPGSPHRQRHLPRTSASPRTQSCSTWPDGTVSTPAEHRPHHTSRSCAAP